MFWCLVSGACCMLVAAWSSMLVDCCLLIVACFFVCVCVFVCVGCCVLFVVCWLCVVLGSLFVGRWSVVVVVR